MSSSSNPSQKGTFRKGSSLFVGGGSPVVPVATSSNNQQAVTTSSNINNNINNSNINMPSSTDSISALRASSALGGTWDDIDGVVEFELSSKSKTGARSLAGGAFPLPESSESSSEEEENDSESQSSTSLKGAGFAGDGVGSRRTFMEYSGDESIMNNGRVTPTSILGGGHDVPLSRSQYLLDHDYESESGSISSSGLTDDDAYFKDHPIAPRTMLTVPKPQHDDTDILPGSSSQDEIFEDDEGAKSSSSEQQKQVGGNTTRLFDDAAPKVSASLLLKKVSSLAWDAYDQDRGRYSGQSRNIKNQRRTSSPSTPSTVSRSPSPSNEHHRASSSSKMIQSFITKQPIRRHDKRLEQDYQVVDATVHQQIALGNALRYSDQDSSSSFKSKEESRPTCEKSWMSDHSSTSSGSMSGWESGDSSDESSSNGQQVKKKDLLPNGLIPRATVEDMLDELDIGPIGLSAIQQLRRMLEEASNSTTTSATETKTAAACFQIHGIEIPNYQAQVRESVANYRRQTLQITDESYFFMPQEGSKSIAAAV